MIEAKCPKCGNKKEFSEDKVGKKFKCPICETIIKIKVDNDNDVEYIEEPTIQDLIINDFKQKQIAADKTRHEDLMRKYRIRRNWAYFFCAIAVYAFKMMLGGNDKQIFSVVLWGGLGAYIYSKGEDYRKEAENLIVSPLKVVDNKKNEAIAQPVDNPLKHNQGRINLKSAKVWSLFDSKTPLYVNGELFENLSFKNGFDISIPITKNQLTLQLVYASIVTKTYELNDLDSSKNYTMELDYKYKFGKIIDNYKIEENG